MGRVVPMEDAKRTSVEVQVGRAMKVVGSEEAFAAACPCARAIRHCIDRSEHGEATSWEFARAVIRSECVEAMYVDADSVEEARELRIGAHVDASGAWILQYAAIDERPVDLRAHR